MTGLLIRWLTNTIALVIVVEIVPGIHADRWEIVGLAALVLGFLNAFLRPFLVLLTLPLHIFSLGFFTLIINGLMLYLVSKVVEGFHVVSFSSAFWGALLFSIISFILNVFIDAKGKINVRFYRERSFQNLRDKDIIDIEGETKNDS